MKRIKGSLCFTGLPVYLLSFNWLSYASLQRELEKFDHYFFSAVCKYRLKQEEQSRQCIQCVFYLHCNSLHPHNHISNNYTCHQRFGLFSIKSGKIFSGINSFASWLSWLDLELYHWCLSCTEIMGKILCLFRYHIHFHKYYFAIVRKCNLHQHNYVIYFLSV